VKTPIHLTNKLAASMFQGCLAPIWISTGFSLADFGRNATLSSYYFIDSLYRHTNYESL